MSDQSDTRPPADVPPPPGGPPDLNPPLPPPCQRSGSRDSTKTTTSSKTFGKIELAVTPMLFNGENKQKFEPWLETVYDYMRVYEDQISNKKNGS